MSGLRPAKKGEVRNPTGKNGREKRAVFTDAFIKLVKEKGLEEAFIKAGVQRALKGNFQFWAYLYERMEGKMDSKLEVKSPTDLDEAQPLDADGNPLDE